MDTKMHALEKAQEMQKNEAERGIICTIDHPFECSKWVVVDVGMGMAIREFKYTDPEPLKKDTLCLCDDGIMRYAMGECDKDSVNKFYVQGFCSKNVGKAHSYFSFDRFEIIETPGEFESMQTQDIMCCDFGCARYVNKWQRVESDKFLNGCCEGCTVLVGTPSNLKTRE